MAFRPCPYRHADDEGHILCEKIKSGDRQVSPHICQACPVAQIDCAHLRAALDHQTRPPIVVRWGNGKMQVWDDMASESISLERAACAEKVVPIHSPRDCAGCAIRRAIAAPEGIVGGSRPQVTFGDRPGAANKLPRGVARAPRAVAATPIRPQPARVATLAEQSNAQVTPAADIGLALVAQKVIQMQEWLAKKDALQVEKESAIKPAAVNPLSPMPSARVVGEEKRAGWTD